MSVRIIKEGFYPVLECACCKCTNKHNELVALIGPIYLCHICLNNIKVDIKDYDSGKIMYIGTVGGG